MDDTKLDPCLSRFLVLERPRYEYQADRRFGLDCRGAANNVCMQQLFDPFEDQLNLPACSVQLENLLGCPCLVEGGHEHNHAEIEEFRFTDRPAFVASFFELATAFGGSDISRQGKSEQTHRPALLLISAPTRDVTDHRIAG
jgi:hypothetical protein